MKEKFDPISPLKRGDSVIIHPHLSQMNKSESPTIASEMLRLVGRKYTVQSFSNYINLKNNSWSWNRKWLVKVPKTFVSSPASLKKLGLKIPKTVKTKLLSEVKINIETHNLLSGAKKWDTPDVFLLGKNKSNDIITLAVKLKRGDGGCSQMPNVRKESFVTGFNTIFKSGKIPCGIARVGRSVGVTPNFGGGSGLYSYEMRDSIVISYGIRDGQNYLHAYQIHPTAKDTNQHKINYTIV